MNETPARDDDLPRDAWLREALRHAPDADAGPPPKLNETILRMGRAAVAPRPERKASPAMPMPSAPSSGGLGQTLAAWWSWLARPPVAGGFAGLMVATVVGVMWWGRPLEEALPPREEAITAATAPAAPPATADVAAAKPAGLPEAAKRAAEPPPVNVERMLRSTAPAEPPAAMKKAEAPPPVAAVVPAPTQAPSPAPATAPAIATDSAAREREALAERREVPAAAARMAGVAPPAPAASSFIETPSLSNLRFEIRRAADTWTWQRDDGESRPMDTAMENWIAQADRASRTVWQAGAVGADTATTTLRFTRGGVVRAVLRLGPSGMRLTRGGKTESAELSRSAASTLQGSLDALGP